MLSNFLKNNYNKLKEISRKITSDRLPDYEDLLHETINALYQVETKKINKMSSLFNKNFIKNSPLRREEEIIKKNELKFYIVRIMLNQYHSKTSPFYYKYKRYNELMNNMEGLYIYSKDPLTKEKLKEFEIKEEKLKWIEKKLEGLHWFDVSVFKIYFKEGFSLNSMSRATKINRSTLGKSIRFVKNYLKNEQEK